MILKFIFCFLWHRLQVFFDEGMVTTQGKGLLRNSIKEIAASLKRALEMRGKADYHATGKVHAQWDILGKKSMEFQFVVDAINRAMKDSTARNGFDNGSGAHEPFSPDELRLIIEWVKGLPESSMKHTMR